jgi:hypothetical protein
MTRLTPTERITIALVLIAAAIYAGTAIACYCALRGSL